MSESRVYKRANHFVIYQNFLLFFKHYEISHNGMFRALFQKSSVNDSVLMYQEVS